MQDGTIPRGYCQCGCGEKTGIARQNRPEFDQVLGQPVRYKRAHHLRKTYCVEDCGYETPCWIWQGYLDRRGYANSNGPVHRRMYERLVGPIPDGLTIDHLCYVPSCVNPNHMEPVTRSENNRRAMARKHGPLRAAIWNLGAQGLRVTDISRELKVGSGTVSKILRMPH